MAQILFADASEQSRSLPLNAQRVVNLFTEKQSPDAKSQVPLFGVPGLTLLGTCGEGPITGVWNMLDVLYVVSGTHLYSLSVAGVPTLLGSGIATPLSGVVGMADNGVQLCIVDGLYGWIYTPATNAFQQITAAAFSPADTVFFFDGYFVFNKRGTNQFFLSALYDGTAYNALDFASAEAQPDFVYACPQNLQLLFVICESHIELWYDAGTADFPFQRYAGGVINYGCIAPYSVIKQDGAIFFLGSDFIFYRLQANVPIRISTHAIEHIISEDPDPQTASCLSYTLEGHKFVVLTLPASNRTLVFDISTNKWHERESWTAADASLGRWRGNCSAQCYGQTLIGDAFGGSVSAIDWSVYTELGNTIRGLAYSAPIHHDRQWIFIPRFELDVQAGVGAQTGPDTDPQIMLGWSKDGAQTFSPLQIWRSMGKIGQYLKRLRWLRLGRARQWVFVLSVTSAVPRVIIGAYADIGIGA